MTNLNERTDPGIELPNVWLDALPTAIIGWAVKESVLYVDFNYRGLRGLDRLSHYFLLFFQNWMSLKE